MDVGVYSYPHGDPLLIDKIVNEFLSQGKFDKLRKECMNDADTKPAYQNLQQRVESTVTQFLKKQIWRPDLNKNQLRDSLRKHILESGFFDAGINRIVDQVVNPNVLATVFMPEVEEVVYNYLSIPRPSDKNQKKGSREKTNSSGSLAVDSQDEDQKPNNLTSKIPTKEKDPEFLSGYPKNETEEDRLKKFDDAVKIESKLKLESEEDNSSNTAQEKMEVPSDESQQSLNRVGVEALQINESEGIPIPDSDDSIPLEINEKSMSDSRDSEDSIMNQMSPISQGRLTPDIIKEEKPEEKVEEKEEKKPLTFIGRIPKIKREDSESSKSSKAELPKKEKLDVKNIYSSDESDSSKSFGKSDSDERRAKEKEKEEGSSFKSEKKHQEDLEKRRKHDDHSKRSKDRSRDRSKDEREGKRDRSRERHSSKKSSSSSSRERSSSRHSSHQSRHKDSKSKDRDKKKKEEEKKKSKTTDDHGKERNKKEDRRSTDRDSNERERDKSTSGRSLGETRKREKDQKAVEGKGEKTQKEESQVEGEVEIEPESGEVIIEVEEAWMAEDGIVLVNDDWIPVEAEPEPEPKLAPAEAQEEIKREDETSQEYLDFEELHKIGALSKLNFPKMTDDFYVKFNSTGFKYFEDWEQAKLDCEEEFKDFIDEAENNLDLLSDDDSDSDGLKDFGFEEENKKTITNLLKGLSNFRKSIMFNPQTMEFYKWTNNKFYQKVRKKEEMGSWESSSRKNESDESTKENIDTKNSGRRSSDGEKENQEKQNKALHLKLLNKYRRQAMRQGRHRRRHKRPKDLSGGIKEKNDNMNPIFSNFSEGFLFQSAKLSGSITKILSKPSLVGGASTEARPGVTTEVESRSRGEADEPSLPEFPEDQSSSEWADPQKMKKMVFVVNPSAPEPEDDLSLSSLPQKCHLPLNLPLSPESDDVNTSAEAVYGYIHHQGLSSTPTPIIKTKRPCKSEPEGGGTPKKQSRRNYSQKYDSQDLYKPRPVLNTSRTRGRIRTLEPEILALGSPVSRTPVYNSSSK